MIKRPEQRVVVLIDTQNMYYSARSVHGQKVNFKKIVEDAVGDRRLIRLPHQFLSIHRGRVRLRSGACVFTRPVL